MVFKNEDNLFYVATYNENGDFVSLSETGYETLGLANASAGIPEGTPSGELVEDNEKPKPKVKVKPVPTETVEVSEDGKTATFEDGSTAPVVSREEVVAELGEEVVAEMEAEVKTSKTK